MIACIRIKHFFLYFCNGNKQFINRLKLIDMTKTIEIQLQKSRMLIQGIKRHINEMGECGVTNDMVAKFEKDLAILEQQSSEVDKIREELNAKVRRMNETFATVKETHAETKKVIKGYHPQERWMDYGVPDKR